MKLRLAAFVACVALATACTPHPASGQLQQSVMSPAAIPAAATCREVNGRADAHCSPGLFAHSPEVTADAPGYKHTLCQPKGVEPRWIASRRPSKSVTDKWKREVMAAYGMSGQPLSSVEGDHIGSLELDGDPGYTRGPTGLPVNFYPELWNGPAGAHIKDHEEDALHSKVCSGVLTLDQAQHQLITDWVR
jgi:hypothetical protein